MTRKGRPKWPTSNRNGGRLQIGAVSGFVGIRSFFPFPAVLAKNIRKTALFQSLKSITGHHIRTGHRGPPYGPFSSEIN